LPPLRAICCRRCEQSVAVLAGSVAVGVSVQYY
jgi:hypothetical protein